MKKYNGYVDSVKHEFAERVFSSKKRVIKFIAICFVPFLYAFICIWAFWNPIPKIGEAPMALVSNDAPVDFIVGKSNNKLAAGQAYSYLEGSTEVVITDATDWDSIPMGTQFTTTAGTQIVKDVRMIHNRISLVDNLVDAWKSGSVDNISYNQSKNKFSIKVSDSMALTNLTYLNGSEAKKVAEQKQDGSWKVKDESKYWAQLQMPTSLSANILGFFDAALQETLKLATNGEVKPPSYFLGDLKQHSMQFWSTYKHNFLFGQFMYIFNQFKSSLLVDMGPQVISQLISLITQNAINNVKNQLIFTAPETISEMLEISDHGSATPHQVWVNFAKDREYVIRNKEVLDAIKAKHPDWSLPAMSIEGTTGTDINQDWNTDGFLSILADDWNQLVASQEGQLIAQQLATAITKKINDVLIDRKLGTVTITADGVKKLFSTAGNIAGLFEQDGTIIPNSSANFAISATGAIATQVTDYKSLITVAQKALHDKFNLISILNPNTSDNRSDYVLGFGDFLRPQKGTFTYNVRHDINAIIHFVVGISTTQNTNQSLNQMLVAPSLFALEGLLPKMDDFVKTTIVGSQFNPYGIGLGEFFLCIGLWVGTLMQTFVFDRAKRVKKAKPWAWYLSKTTLMMITAWIQTTVLMITVYALGWSAIGSAFGLMYLWMMLTASVFVIIQQALWFSLQDETVGKFLIILLLIINLSSGWGTFPTFMQAGIFNFLSYFAPYTYSMHGQGAIIYSIAVNGANWADTMYILQQTGILLIWTVIFIVIGLLAAILRNREIYYGTAKSKKLGKILVEQKLNKYVNPKTQKAIWKALPKEEMLKVRKKVRERYPEEGQYQWYKEWKAKHKPDDPVTASESDDEIMRRNN